MKITSTAVAWVCVALLVLYPVSAILVWAYLAPESYGIMAALFAANAATALFIGFTFRLPAFSSHTSRALRFFVVSIAVVCGLMSAVFWMADEVDNVWLRAGIVSPVLVILLVLMWFIDTVNKGGTQHKGE